jgi:hypothetical protein
MAAFTLRSTLKSNDLGAKIQPTGATSVYGLLPVCKVVDTDIRDRLAVVYPASVQGLVAQGLDELCAHVVLIGLSASLCRRKYQVFNMSV